MIQMSKERLEELKGVLKSWEAWNDWNESQRIVLKDLTYYLERVQDLEGDAENIYRANHDYSRRNDILTQQNKRYREALEFIVNIDGHFMDKPFNLVEALNLIDREARGALESEK